jgi:hypothetical protein
VTLRDDQYVRWRLRINVPESDRFVRFQDNVGGDIAARNFAKKAV